MPVYGRHYDFTEAEREEAKEILAILATPTQPEHPDYDPIRAQKREDLIFTTSYTHLKLTLMRYGLRKNGEKVEMMTRMLLYIIDPRTNHEEK
jgi:hypothetical protein